jgi:hypothetical protein
LELARNFRRGMGRFPQIVIGFFGGYRPRFSLGQITSGQTGSYGPKARAEGPARVGAKPGNPYLLDRRAPRASFLCRPERWGASDMAFIHAAAPLASRDGSLILRRSHAGCALLRPRLGGIFTVTLPRRSPRACPIVVRGLPWRPL